MAKNLKRSVFKGNGQVGDAVIVLRRETSTYAWRFHGRGRIITTGVRSGHGYRLNVRVQPTRGRPFVTSTFDSVLSPEVRRVLVLPPEDEVPAELAEWAHGEGLLVVRACGNNETFVYRALCQKCWHEVHRELEMIETQELRFVAGRPPAGGWPATGMNAWFRDEELADSNAVLTCNCDGKRYDDPPGLDTPGPDDD